MTPEVYIKKVVTIQADSYAYVRAVRKRDTTGYASISLTIGSESITISNDVDEYGDHYEMIVRELVEILDKIVNESCYLPPNKM